MSNGLFPAITYISTFVKNYILKMSFLSQHAVSGLVHWFCSPGYRVSFDMQKCLDFENSKFYQLNGEILY